jgi:hypothetical protein
MLELLQVEARSIAQDISGTQRLLLTLDKMMK